MIKSNLIDEILKDCGYRRNLEILRCEKIKDKLNENPTFYALQKQKNVLVMEKGKAIFENKDTNLFDTQLKEIDGKQQQILKEMNIDSSSLVPHFACNQCEDTGFVNGKLCACVKQKYNNALMLQSNIDFKSVPYLDDYDTSIFPKEVQQKMELLKTNLQEFVKDFGEVKIKNIVFAGATGVGKTFLAQSVAKQVIKTGQTALFCSAFEINNIFLEAHTSLNADKVQALNQLIEPELLIVDDLGTEPIFKKVTCEYLLLLINERNLHNKCTIFTTNLMPDKILDKYSERVFSRLFNKTNSLLISFNGEDLRLKK